MDMLNYQQGDDQEMYHSMVSWDFSLGNTEVKRRRGVGRGVVHAFSDCKSFDSVCKVQYVVVVIRLCVSRSFDLPEIDFVV